MTSSSPSNQDGIAAGPPVRTVFLHVTTACNLHCSYCYSSAGRPLPDEMTGDELVQLYTEIVKAGPQKVVLTGGEPLLRPGILQTMSRFRIADPEHRVLLCLNSNGHLVTAETAKALVGLADEVRVSLDGMRDRNDMMRGSGSFDAAIHALECFYAVGFEPKVLITVTSITVPDLEELIGFLTDRSITRINVDMFRPIGRGFGRKELCVEPRSLYDAVRRVWLRYWPDRPFGERIENGCQEHCGVGRFLSIMPNGDVFPCHVLTNPEFRCGNVRSRSLSEICQRTGLVGQLAELDFRDLVRVDDDLAELTRSGTCMGTVYATTKSSRVWRTRLSLAQN